MLNANLISVEPLPPMGLETNWSIDYNEFTLSMSRFEIQANKHGYHLPPCLDSSLQLGRVKGAYK